MEARKRLAAFDLVSVSNCIPQLLLAIEKGANLQPLDNEKERAARMAASFRRPFSAKGISMVLRVQPKTSFPSQQSFNASHAWTWEALSVEAQQRLLHLTRCDAILYADSLRIGNATMPGGCNAVERFAANRTGVPPHSMLNGVIIRQGDHRR